MTSYNIPQPERYINPNRVNTTKFIKIFSTDPRNNPRFLQENPFTIIVDANFDNEVEIDDDFFNQPDPQDNNAEDDSGEPENIILQPPKNLSISNFELKVNNDGTVYYTATLYFDDVDGAESYKASFEVAK